MDPVTHAVIGMAISTAGQGKFQLLSPVTIAAVVGSVMPDGDIVLWIKGNSFYLKHHRGVSHSIIGIAIESIMAAGLMKLFYKWIPFTSLLLWTFVGCLTHILSDILNSYGARILWPISHKMKSLSLLIIADPIIVALSALTVLSSYNSWDIGAYIIGTACLYLLSRVIMRVYVKAMLNKEFQNIYDIKKYI